jgi:hypothetical protein
VTWQDLLNTDPLFQKNRHIYKITRTGPPPNPNFRMIAVRNLVGLALCLAVADRAAGSPQDPSEPISSETEPTKSVNQEITNLLKAYEKALNSHDPKAVMALYGSDPIFIPQNAEAVIGREAVQARTNAVPRPSK